MEYANTRTQLQSESEYLFIRRWAWIPILVGVFAVLAWSAVNKWPEIEQTIDIDQGRLDTAVPAPQPEYPLSQTVTPDHDGLSEIELLLVHYDEDDRGNHAWATLTLKDQHGRIIASHHLVNSEATHNQTIKLTFSPQADSAGQKYTLTMSGQEGNKLALWGYSLPLLGDDHLVSGQETAAQTLYFKTRYTLTLPLAFATVGEQLARYGGALLLALAWLPLPGLLLMQWWPVDERLGWPILIRWGMCTALGIAIWPLIWYWWSFVGYFSSARLWFLFILGWLIFVYNARHTISFASFSLRSLLAPIPFGLILVLRFLTIRDLVFLPWVDASRHGLITAAFARAGYWTNSYEPYLSVTDGFYHYGFHTLSASLHLMLGENIPLNELLLVLMQLLSMLVCLMVFTAAWLFVRHNPTAWIATFLVAIPFLFPSYYTTWGRLTQLTAVLLLPLAIALTWNLLCKLSDLRSAIWLAFLVAGIALIHMRVFMIYLPAVLVFALFSGRRLGKSIVYLLGSGITALLLVMPRLWQVIEQFLARRAVIVTTGQPSNNDFNRFPTGYVNAAWEKPILLGVGVGLVLLLAVLLWKKVKGDSSKHIPPAIWALALWGGGTLLLTAGKNLHPDWPILLPEVSVNSAYITLFVPMGLVLALTAVALHHYFSQKHWLAHLALYIMWGVIFTSLTLFGIPHQLNMLNESTLLGRPADIEALVWLDQHAPADAKIAHGSWKWLGETWAGSDGGAWIVPLTGRLSTTPPIDHVYNSELFAEVGRFNHLATTIKDWSTPATADFLHQHGVDYIFVGAKGGYFDPAELNRNNRLELVYHHKATFIFAIMPP